MFVSVGSKSNDSDDEAESRRARIFEYTPSGGNERVYAYGIRNAVGLAIHPATGELWASVNERDELGDARTGGANRLAQPGLVRR